MENGKWKTDNAPSFPRKKSTNALIVSICRVVRETYLQAYPRRVNVPSVARGHCERIRGLHKTAAQRIHNVPL